MDNARTARTQLLVFSGHRHSVCRFRCNRFLRLGSTTPWLTRSASARRRLDCAWRWEQREVLFAIAIRRGHVARLGCRLSHSPWYKNSTRLLRLKAMIGSPEKRASFEAVITSSRWRPKPLGGDKSGLSGGRPVSPASIRTRLLRIFVSDCQSGKGSFLESAQC
jgi:hypothetical protein